jgi:hypothetical protein
VEEGDYFQGDYLEEDREGELESNLTVVWAEEVSLKVLGVEEEGYKGYLEEDMGEEVAVRLKVEQEEEVDYLEEGM